MRSIWTVAIFAILLAVSFVAPAAAAMVTISGEVTYRERVALPPNASLRISLVDLTAPGTPTKVSAEAAIGTPGQVPLVFALNFDDRVVNATHQHALVAEISSGLEVVFRNAEPYPLDPLAAPETPIVIITSIVANQADAPAEDAAPMPITSILDVTWKAVSIRGQPTVADSTLQIGADMRAGGRGGCNSYFATATLGADTIAFSAVGSTKMLCTTPAINEQEQAFFAALAAARRYALADRELALFNDAGTELIRFTAN